MQVKFLLFESYVAAIKNSVGSHVFKTLFADVDGKSEDILYDGRRSCGAFISGILVWFGLIKERHATVAGTVKDLKASGWEEIREPRIGAILHWEKELGNGEENEHLGFYIGGDRAVSTSREKRTPIEHHYTYGEDNGKPKRRIIAIYWHQRLNK